MAVKGNLTRTAKQVKTFSVLIKGASLLAACLTALVAVVYVFSFMYEQYGNFTVSVNKYDMVKQGLSLSEDGEFTEPVAKLNAAAVKEITNISTDVISADVDQINGSHNGGHYIAYTFYMKNVGEDTISYNYTVNIMSVTNEMDSAIRFRLYKNGEPTTYAKTKTDGTGAETGTQPFHGGDTVVSQTVDNFAKQAVDKYTVVIWLEGNDPDCVDNVVGGQIKLGMNFTIAA